MSDMICAEELVDTTSRSYRMKHVDLKTPCIIDEKYVDKSRKHAIHKVIKLCK